MIMIWKGGLSFHGGLIGAVTAALIFCKKFKVKFYDLADLVVIPTALFLGLGRIANFLNAENVGTITNLSWCVKFPTAYGCRHPVQLYEAIKNFVIVIILGSLYAKKQEWKIPKGAIFWFFWLFYGILRFVITFVREDPRRFGISLGQYLCLIMIVVSVIFLIRLYKNEKK
jgi:phosphatidylglycerol:prolipoprotein diacylglycerol transferase